MLVSLCPPDTVNVVYVTCSLHVNSQRWLMSSGWGWVPSEMCVSRSVITGSLSPLLLLCFTGNEAVIYGRIHHTVMKSQHDWVTGIWLRMTTRTTTPKTFYSDEVWLSAYLVIFGDYLSPLLVKFHRRILLGIRRWRQTEEKGKDEWVSISFRTLTAAKSGEDSTVCHSKHYSLMISFPSLLSC